MSRPTYADYKKRILDRYVDVLFGHIHDPAKILAEYEQYVRFCTKNYGADMPEDRGASILDLGCGLGHFQNYLRTANYRNCLGVDASEQLIAHCREQGFKVVQSDLIDFVTSTTERYDLVVLEGVLNYLDKGDVLYVLERVRAILVPGGKCFIKCINLSNPIVASNTRYRDFVSETGFTEESLRQVCLFAGFPTVEVHAVDVYVTKSNIANLAGRSLAALVTAMLRFLFALHGRPDTKVFSKDMLAICSS
jgi:predicted TPR repeat methyltransferase